LREWRREEAAGAGKRNLKTRGPITLPPIIYKTAIMSYRITKMPL